MWSQAGVVLCILTEGTVWVREQQMQGIIQLQTQASWWTSGPNYSHLGYVHWDVAVPLRKGDLGYARARSLWHSLAMSVMFIELKERLGWEGP